MAPRRSRAPAAQARPVQNTLADEEEFDLNVSGSDDNDDQPLRQARRRPQGPDPAADVIAPSYVHDFNPPAKENKNAAADVHYFFEKVDGQRICKICK